MKMTLLELTQNILSAMSSDDVNSIDDTVEARQVAEIVKETYFALIANMERPEHHRLIQLEGVADTDKPNYLKIPDNVEVITDFRYDVREDGDTDPRWKDIEYCIPAEFIRRTQARKTSESNVDQITDYNSVVIYVLNDTGPSFWTTFDDKYIVCDAYNSDVETTLQTSKNSCLARYTPTFTMEDTFVPDIDAHLFPLLLAESKSMCFVNIKGIENVKVEKQARQQKTAMHNDKHRFRPDVLSSTPNYGRRRPS